MKRIISLYLAILLLGGSSFAAQISRTNDAEIENGQIIDAADLDAELNSLVTESNSQDTRLTDIESNALTIGGVKTFSSTPKTNGIAERTAGAGVTFSGSTSKILVDNINESTAYNGVAVDSLRVENGYAVQPGFIRGCTVSWVDATSIQVSATCAAADSTNSDIIVPSGALTIDMDNANGALGRDTGAEAGNTWYYVYLIKKSSDDTVSALISTTNEASSGSITLPSGYDKKRQLRIAIRNDGSSNIIDFIVMHGWPDRPFIQYNVLQEAITSAVGPTNVLDGKTASGTTTVSCGSYVPPISKLAFLKYGNIYISGTNILGLGAAGGTLIYRVVVNSATTISEGTTFIPTNASQQVDVSHSGAGGESDLSVFGYVVTEIP